MSQMIWPEVMTTNIPTSANDIYPDLDGEKRVMAVLGDQLMAWGNCCSGVKLAGELPECFGSVMVMMRTISGATTLQECHIRSDEILAARAARREDT